MTAYTVLAQCHMVNSTKTMQVNECGYMLSEADGQLSTLY